MTTIVRYSKNQQLYILVGSGHGMFRSARPGMVLGDLFPREEEGSESKVAVCDDNGRILWGMSDDLTVVSVDGRDPATILAEARSAQS